MSDVILKDLKPEFFEENGVGEIVFACPDCNHRIAIKYSRLASGRDSQGCNVWKASGDIGDGTFSLEPSIQQHAIGINWPKCSAHFSISNGRINRA